MEKLAEIIETGTTGYVAQCYELFNQPPFGSLVKTKNGQVEIYGAVYQASTAGIEPGRRPIARGKDEPDEEALYQANPQLNKLLCSEFSVLVLGFKYGGVYSYYLPPAPARIHGFVYPCSTDDQLTFSKSLDFLSIILNAHLSISGEEVISAILRQLSSAYRLPGDFLVRAGKELSILLGNDYVRLKTILSKLR